MSEEDYEDIEEQEETRLHGEYVWNGRQLTSADSNVDDSGGHQGYFLQQIIGELYEDTIELAKNVKEHLETLPEDQLTADQEDFLEKFNINVKDIGNNDHGFNPDEFQSFLGQLETVDPSSYNNFKEDKAEIIEGFKNPVLWGCKQGNIVVRQNSFELCGWEQSKAKDILKIVDEIVGRDTASPTTSLDIYDHNVDKIYHTTVGELQSGEKPQNIIPSALKTKSNIHIPWDRSMLQGDSNNFTKFKNWIKLRENRN